MYFKITVSNGHFPLEHRCSTAHEAFGCIETLSTGLLHNMPIDMDEIMALIVAMKEGKMQMHQNYNFKIKRIEGEV